MDIEKIETLKYLFSTKENDMRSILFVIILDDMINKKLELTTDNLYNLPYMINLKKNEEWITYCMDLASVTFIDKYNIQYSKYSKFIQPFFIIEENSIDLTNDIKKWSSNSMMTRMKDKITGFTGIVPLGSSDKSYNISNNTYFSFNTLICNIILKTLIKNQPPLMEQHDMVLLDTVEQCFVQNKTHKKCIDYLEYCFKGKDVTEFKKYMNQDTFSDNIIKEVKDMDVCEAVRILDSLNFKYDHVNKKHFESYESWIQRTVVLLKIKDINPGLKKYIKLLLEKVNIITKLKKQLNKYSERKIKGISKIMTHCSTLMNDVLCDEMILSHNNLENKYYIADNIITIYDLLSKVCNNKIVFNNDNKHIYTKYYDKIKHKYLKDQKTLLNYIEKNI